MVVGEESVKGEKTLEEESSLFYRLLSFHFCTILKILNYSSNFDIQNQRTNFITNFGGTFLYPSTQEGVKAGE